MIELSEHYLPYEHPVFIVLAGGDRARVLKGEERTLEEVHAIDFSDEEYETDEGAAALRARVYQDLSQFLNSVDVDDLVLCAPEVFQHELQDSLPPAQQKKVTQLIPKNLASLPLDAVLRILQEHQE